MVLFLELMLCNAYFHRTHLNPLPSSIPVDCVLFWQFIRYLEFFPPVFRGHLIFGNSMSSKIRGTLCLLGRYNRLFVKVRHLSLPLPHDVCMLSLRIKLASCFTIWVTPPPPSTPPQTLFQQQVIMSCVFQGSLAQVSMHN